MYYGEVVPAEFVERKNRFIAECMYSGELVRVHVRNTGRCRELLKPGARVFLQQAPAGASRSTKWSLVSVYKEDVLFNIDSQMPNHVFREALEREIIVLPGIGQIAEIKPEATFGESRLDFYIRGSLGEAYAEVKGVTLEIDGIARFPDAPTERGIKHLNSLIRAKEMGYHAFAVFVLQFDGAVKFMPNWDTHPQFGDALRKAKESGVGVIAVSCTTRPGEIYCKDTVCVEI